MKAIERLYQYLSIKGVKPTNFEREIGLSNGYLSAQKKRLANLGEEIILKITENCRDLSIVWFLTGEGEMLIEKNAQVEKKYTPEYTPKYTPVDQKAELELSRNVPMGEARQVARGGIPLIPIEAAAGALSGPLQAMDFECEYYVIPSFKNAEFMIRITGDSMLPKYQQGDIVACQRLSLGTFFQWNNVYVVDSEQGALIKRIKRGSDNEHILLVSENKDYEPFELALSEINGLGQVIGIVRLE